MIIIVGLGNPGTKYEKTRHNVGFMALDILAKEFKTEFKVDKKREAEIAIGMLTFPGEKKHVRFALIKPQTFMNESGRAVRALADYYRVRTEDQLWVIHDDLDIALGTIRIRLSGSSAGQKGIQSIIDNLGTDRFVRFRVGIKPEEGQTITAEQFVLENFKPSEKEIIKKELEELKNIILESMDQGVAVTSI